MEQEKIENAIITDTYLGVEGGYLTARIDLDGGGWCCSFGDYVLGHWDDTSKNSSGYAAWAISELLKAIGVKSWEQLSDTYVRVKRGGWGGRIVAVGNILHDKWFSFENCPFDPNNNSRESSDVQM